MLVYDKTSSIAILRTMGASRAAITRIFFLSGSIVGFVGTAAGLVLGVVFCLNIESIRGLMESLTGTELFRQRYTFYQIAGQNRLDRGRVRRCYGAFFNLYSLDVSSLASFQDGAGGGT